MITNTLQILLPGRLDKTLLDHSYTNAYVDSNSPSTITGNRLEHSPYSHNRELHQWLKTTTHHNTQQCDYDNYPPPLLLYDIEEIDAVTTQATTTYHDDITQYLTFTEWRTTTSQHTTMRPSHPLHSPLSD